jgi:NAD(P)H-dependent FMN reductase
MSVLLLNASPRKNGNVAALLGALAEGVSDGLREDGPELRWVDVCDLAIAPCRGCMSCRPDGVCVMPQDDGHVVGEMLREARALVVGTPTHWANMSSPLKALFDRNVPAFIGEKPNGLPMPRVQGAPAAVVTACSAPWPFNFLLPESRGALRAVRHVLKAGGWSVRGTVTKPGTKASPGLDDKLLRRARRLGRRVAAGM